MRKTPKGHLILVTGPARCGKSEWAEALAADSGQAVIYVATAQMDPTDAEWQSRIETHQQRRPPHWTTVHVPVNLAQIIQQTSSNQCLLIDSVGSWLTNLLEQNPLTWQQTVQRLLESLMRSHCTVILVAEETGWGVVPAYPLGRTFRDRLGELARRIGAIADEVYLVTSGYALNLKVLGTPIATPLPSEKA